MMAKVAGDKSKTVHRIPLACADEHAAVEFMEEMRWGSEPACPRCGDTNVYQMKNRAGERNARYLWRCRGCRKQYTVRVGTVMEDSPIPLRHWCYAFWAACASKKGVSALQIKRQTGLTYKSALYLMHRIRLAMDGSGNVGPLDGDVEADETYVGGKLRKHSHQAWKKYGKRRKRGGGKDRLKNKTPVMALVSRSGQARARVPTDVKGHNLKRVLAETVAPTARIHTDEDGNYHGLAD
jgi:transposase-like protein